MPKTGQLLVTFPNNSSKDLNPTTTEIIKIDKAKNKKKITQNTLLKEKKPKQKYKVNIMLKNNIKNSINLNIKCSMLLRKKQNTKLSLNTKLKK